jgi:beta-mannanase
VGLYLPDDFCSAPQRAYQYQPFLGRKFQILSFYVAWGPGNGRPDLAGIEEVLGSGFVPMITWEPWWPHVSTGGGRPEDQPDFSLSSILGGKYEDYIWNWAIDLKKVQGPIFFRPMHEMNGNWYPWCGRVNGNKLKDSVETWRYIRSIFRKAHNDRLIWVWSPYVHSVPDEPDNEIWHYFPGTQEVDWVGLDGYNWGTNREWSKWQSFQEIFSEAYDQLTRLAPEKPFMIAEVGCAEEGGNKRRWIEETFETLGSRFIRVKALVWFNIKKECDWRIESSRESLISFREHVSHWQRHFQPEFEGG